MNEMQAHHPLPLGRPRACATCHCHPIPRPFSGLAHLHGLAPTKAIPSLQAMTPPKSMQRTNQGAKQPLPEGGSGGGGGDPSTPGKHGPPDGDGGGDSLSLKLLEAITTHGPAIIVGLVTMIAAGIFYQCAFAMPARQRDIAEIKSGQDYVTLMVQRLCAALGKPECALPPNACA